MLKRLFWGTLLGVGFGLVVLAGGELYTAAVAAFALLALWELYELARRDGMRPYRFTGLAGALALVLWAHYFGLKQGAALVILAIFYVSLGIHPFLAGLEGRSYRDAALTVAGALYAGFAAASAVELRKLGVWHAFFLYGVVWSFDVLAYFTGKFLGKHKVFPRISPKKTWEGAFGGLLGAGLSGWLLGLGAGWAPWLSVPLALGVAAVGHLGDFFESAIKRDVGVKDSSSLIPGHGGVLDRLDSLVFAAPALFLLLSILGVSR